MSGSHCQIQIQFSMLEVTDKWPTSEANLSLIGSHSAGLLSELGLEIYLHVLSWLPHVSCISLVHRLCVSSEMNILHLGGEGECEVPATAPAETSRRVSVGPNLTNTHHSCYQIGLGASHTICNTSTFYVVQQAYNNNDGEHGEETTGLQSAEQTEDNLVKCWQDHPGLFDVTNMQQ